MPYMMKTPKLTFKAVADQFLADAGNRRNNPLRPNTLSTYRHQIETHQIPAFGHLPLEDVDNDRVKALIDQMHAEKLSAATIRLNFTIIKKIRQSARNKDRSVRFPIMWDMQYLDIPSGDSKTTIISAQTVQDAISALPTPEEALVAVLAGTGLRIGEALALIPVNDETVTQPYANYWYPKDRVLVIRGQRDQKHFGPTKTDAGARQVDLSEELNNFLQKLFAGKEGFMFPKSATHYAKKFNQVGLAGGFHSLRRFRTTHLNKSNCPTGLEYFWMGHAAKDVHGGYINFGKEIESRKSEAQRIGLGFTLETK